MRNIVVKILNVLATQIVEKYKPVIIGVTGSVGKSTTSRVISEILKTKYEVRLNNSAYRSDINIPLAIIGAESGKQSIAEWVKVFAKALALIFKKSSFYPDVIILNMAVNRPDDMKKMLQVVHPDVAVFTGVGEIPAHIEYFKSGKHIAREKSLLFKSLNKKDLAVLNMDDEFIRNLSGSLKCDIMTYGFASDLTVKGEEIFLGEKKWKTSNGKIGMSFKITYEGTTVPFRFSYALGRGQIYAALAGAAVGLHFGFNLVEISQALANYTTLPGRMNLIKGMKGSLIIDDTFNASPKSVLAALETMRKLEAKRKIAVLADMLELGKCTEFGHKNVGECVSTAADLVFCYGENAGAICNAAKEKGMKEEKIFYFDNKKDLIDQLKDMVEEGDIILVKGSRAMKMEEVVETLMLEPEKANELLVR